MEKMITQSDLKEILKFSEHLWSKKIKEIYEKTISAMANCMNCEKNDYCLKAPHKDCSEDLENWELKHELFIKIYGLGEDCNQGQ